MYYCMVLLYGDEYNVLLYGITVWYYCMVMSTINVLLYGITVW